MLVGPHHPVAASLHTTPLLHREKGHYNVQTEGCEHKCKQTTSEFKVFPPWNWLSCGGKPLYPPWIHRAASRTCLLGIQQFSPWTFQLCSIPSLLAHVYHPCHCWALQWQHWSLWLPRIALSAWHWHMGTVVRWFHHSHDRPICIEDMHLGACARFVRPVTASRICTWGRVLGLSALDLHLSWCICTMIRMDWALCSGFSDSFDSVLSFLGWHGRHREHLVHCHTACALASCVCTNMQVPYDQRYVLGISHGSYVRYFWDCLVSSQD